MASIPWETGEALNDRERTVKYGAPAMEAPFSLTEYRQRLDRVRALGTRTRGVIWPGLSMSVSTSPAKRRLPTSFRPVTALTSPGSRPRRPSPPRPSERRKATITEPMCYN